MKHLSWIISLLGIFYVYRIGRYMMTESTETGKEQEIDVVARTIWGEARGENNLGKIAVANVIGNRVKAKSWFGTTFEDVCKKSSITGVHQFSCWNKNDPNYQKLLTVTTADRQFIDCYLIAEQIVNRKLADNTGGANHYHTNSIKPYWADDSKKTAVIGNHTFYKL